jgi:nucleotide-binding universal stress UspA family protein
VSAAHALHDLAIELDAAAIVVGSSHRGRIGRVLAGDVSTSLLRGAPSPVLVAPRDYTEAPTGSAGSASGSSIRSRGAPR